MVAQRADEGIRETSSGAMRRGLLAAAGAMVAGFVAAQAAHHADAAPINGGSDGTALIIGGGGSGCSCSPNTTTFGTSLISSNGGFPAFVGSNTASGGIGLQGQCDTASGVGVRGLSNLGFGISGASNGNAGIVGTTTASGNAGLAGIVGTPNTAAFAGTATVAGAFAGFFTGDVFVNGNFTVLDPTKKHGAIAHPDGTHRILYAMESPEAWVEDFGKGRLAAGKATVALDSDFAAITQTDDYHVFPVPEGECNGLYITDRTAVGFAVRELGNGTSDVTFRYRIVARPRTPNAAARLAPFTVPER